MERVKWVADFKTEFLRRTGITWNEGAGMDDQDAFDRYYPEAVGESVQHYMDKYDLFDINDDFK